MNRKAPLQVYLDSTDRSLLDRLAQRLGVPRAEVVRLAIRRWASELMNEHDPLLALIGTIDDASLPEDLSTRSDDVLLENPPARRVAEPSD